MSFQSLLEMRQVFHLNVISWRHHEYVFFILQYDYLRWTADEQHRVLSFLDASLLPVHRTQRDGKLADMDGKSKPKT